MLNTFVYHQVVYPQVIVHQLQIIHHVDQLVYLTLWVQVYLVYKNYKNCNKRVRT
eukprot:UN08686